MTSSKLSEKLWSCTVSLSSCHEVGIFKVHMDSVGVCSPPYLSTPLSGIGLMKSLWLNLGTSISDTSFSTYLTGDCCDRFILSKCMVCSSSILIWLEALGRWRRRISFFKLCDDALVVHSMSHTYLLNDLMIDSLIYKVSLGLEFLLKLSWSFFQFDELITLDMELIY